jgi:nucleoid-associated protein YgaU
VDGVERVMVLGILAVIVAILSFAWSATDESAAPAGALGRDVDSGISPIRLSSSSSAGDTVVLGEADRDRIAERRQTNTAAREARLKQRGELLQGSPSPARLATSGGSSVRAENSLAPHSTSPGAGANELLAEQRREVLDVSDQMPLKPTGALNEGEPSFLLYEVASGDTLWDIAYRSVGAGDTKRMVEHIQYLNPGVDSSNLPVGRTLKLPKVVPAQMQNMTPTERAKDTGGRVYIVGEGDTLGAIALLELGDGSRWKEVYQLNKTTISDPERIRPGQRLILPDE